MHFTEPAATEPQAATSRSRRQAALGVLALLGALAAGCGSAPPRAPAPATPPPPPAPPPPPRPAPAPAPAVPVPPPPPPPPPSPPAPRPRTAPDMGPAVALPPAPASRSAAEFQRMAAQRLVRANPAHTYMGKPPPMMWAIVIVETTLNADGSVRDIRITRPPANPAAAPAAEYAAEAIRRAAPYGDVSRLPQPVRWSEIFLFNEKYQFKPRTLD